MKTAFQPRPYQDEGVTAVLDAFERDVRHPAVVWPTGAGKTVGFATLGKLWLAKRGHGSRMLVVAHRRELISQAVAKCRKAMPGVPVGVVMGSLNQTNATVVVASVATLRSEMRRKMIGDVGLIVIDECHHATASTYGAVIAHWPNARVVGFTATMVRSDKSALGDVWAEVVHSVSIAEMIRGGWLVRPIGIRVKVDSLNMTGVKVRGGDYQASDLGEALEQSLAPEAIAKAIMEHAADRPTLCFTPTVHSAEVVKAALIDAGLTAEVVSGKTPDKVRDARIEAYRARKTQVLVNCGVFTEGTDLPLTGCVVIARQTKSVGLFIQMAGRGLRIDEDDPNKTDCILLIVVPLKGMSLATPIVLFGDDVEAAHELADLDDFDDPAEPDGDQFLDLLDEDGAPDFPGPAEPDGVDGPLIYQHIDLFAASPMAWHRTHGGVPFLQAGKRYITLLPTPGIDGWWDILIVDQTRLGTGVWVTRGVTSQSEAMRLAEQQVTAAERNTAERQRGTRYRVPSRAQVRLADRLGLGLSPKASHGEVSDALTTHFGSLRLDPYIPESAKARARSHA